MIRVRTLVLVTALSACGVAGPMALPSRPAVAAAEPKEPKNLDTPLSKEMETMDEGLKKLRRSLRDPAQNATSLEWIAKIQAATVASKGMTPAMASTIPEADRGKWVINYRKDMAKLLATMAQMEVAVLDGDSAKAQDLYKSLKTQESEGHEKFTQQ